MFKLEQYYIGKNNPFPFSKKGEKLTNNKDRAIGSYNLDCSKYTSHILCLST